MTLDGLTAGEHTLEVFVANSFGPAALLAVSRCARAFAPGCWMGGKRFWRGLVARYCSVDDVQPPVSEQTAGDSPATALKKNSLVACFPCFSVFCWCSIFATGQTGARGRMAEPGGLPRVANGVLIVAWLILAANNFLKSAWQRSGYDVQGAYRLRQFPSPSARAA